MQSGDLSRKVPQQSFLAWRGALKSLHAPTSAITQTTCECRTSSTQRAQLGSPWASPAARFPGPPGPRQGTPDPTELHMLLKRIQAGDPKPILLLFLIQFTQLMAVEKQQKMVQVRGPRHHVET